MSKTSLDGGLTSTPKVDQNGKIKISGPVGGAPITAGYKFGASGKDKDKDAAEQSIPGSDRREKAKSKMFWGFGRPNGMQLFAFTIDLVTSSIDGLVSSEKNAVPVQPQPSRVVFGTSLEESLEVV